MWSSIRSEISIEFEVADYGRKNGTFIQELFSPLPELPSLGVVTSGGIKYSYKGDIVDLMGLNNTIMAHNHGDRKGIKNHAAFDIQTFYQLQPDIVWPRTVIEKNWQYTDFEIKESWENKEGLKGLFDEPNFLDLYSYAKVSSTLGNGYALVAWFKKDFLKQLNTNPDFLIEEYP
jgi:arabinofuranosyltransferase